MNIIYLIPHSPSSVGFDSTGSFIRFAAYHREVCHALLRRGINVKILMQTHEEKIKKKIAGIPVEAYEVTMGSSFGRELSIELLRQLRSGMTADLIHLHGYNQPNAIPHLAAILGQHQTIVQNHGSALDQDNLKHKLWYQLITPFLRHCGAILSVDRDELNNLAPLIKDQTKLYHLPNAINPSQFEPSSKDAARRSLGLDPNAHYGLFVGRLTGKKGIKYLLNAAADLDPETDLTLLLVYSGSSDKQKQMIESQITKLGIGDRIKMIGSVDHDRMSIFYNAADFCVFPSVSEGFGVVVLESMACGTPVIASEEHLGGGHVIDGENCLIIDPRSPDDIGDSIHQMLSSPVLRKKLSERGRETVLEQYTYEVMIEDLIDCYQELVR